MISDPAASPDSKQDPEKPTVLVVDDSRLMRHAIKKILAADFTMQEGVDGEDGWEKLLADPGIQVVFTDLSMPGLDGFGLLQRIRSSEEARIREVPVIVITGNEDDETIKERALQSGATDFITKPFQSVQIRARARAEAHAKNQRKLQEVTSALEEQATVDAVTQLANTRHFMQHGNENLSFAVRHKSELAMIMLELDNFAALNANMDQATRDQILVAVADVLRAQTRREDTLARLDAARFGVLLPASNSVGTRHLGKRMLAEIEQLKFFHDGRRVKVSASVGIATPDIKTETTLESIIQCADKRLTVALQGGGNCLVKDDQTTVASLQEAMRQAQEEVLAQQRAEEEARQSVEAEAARIKAKAEARQRAEAEAQAKVAEAARLRAEEEVRIKVEAEAQAKAAEAEHLRAEEAARIKADLEAQQRAEMEAIALAAEEVRVRAQAQEVERVQRNAEEAEWMQANVEIGELKIITEARSDIDVPDDKHSLEQFEIAAARQRAEQEAAQRRVEAESRRRALEDEEKARATEVMRRRAAMEAELARVESKLNGAETDIQSVSGEHIPTDAEPMALRGPIAAVLRGVMPLLDAVNRRFKNKWDNKLDALRKRL